MAIHIKNLHVIFGSHAGFVSDYRSAYDMSVPTFSPHSGQYRSSGRTGAPQDGQRKPGSADMDAGTARGDRGVAHTAQKLASGPFALPQFGQTPAEGDPILRGAFAGCPFVRQIIQIKIAHNKKAACSRFSNELTRENPMLDTLISCSSMR